MDLVKDACTERIYPVGRLDKNSMGVLLFTNDGELTKKLTVIAAAFSATASEKIQKVVDAKDNVSIIKIFKELILKAYGVKSDDGKRFIKSQQLSEEFAQTEAYSILFMELATNADAAAEFVNGIVSQDVNKQMAAAKHPANK